MAAIIARALAGELDVVLVHKLGAPGQPELAIGAVDEDGHVLLTSTASDVGVDEAYIARERDAQTTALRRQRERYTPARPPSNPSGRLVIVVDDGIATGATLIAALHVIRSRKPARLVAAAAVAPVETVERLKQEADEVVVLHAPAVFLAVGEFFQDFRQVSEEEVVAALVRDAAELEPASHWELFAHQADMGVRGIGPSRERAFEQAALALTAVIVDPRHVADRETVTVHCAAPNEEILLVDWLNAIIYEMATRKMLFGHYEVRIVEGELHGSAWGERVDVGRHEPAVEIKGASMTELQVARRADGAWVAQCVVDV
jgi:predicted phosphoribosyltransferase